MIFSWTLINCHMLWCLMMIKIRLGFVHRLLPYTTISNRLYVYLLLTRCWIAYLIQFELFRFDNIWNKSLESCNCSISIHDTTSVVPISLMRFIRNRRYIRLFFQHVRLICVFMSIVRDRIISEGWQHRH